MKFRDLRDRAQATLAREVGYIVKPHGARLRVALAFPNTYFVGMSNLGLQTVYRLFNAARRRRVRAGLPAAEAGTAGRSWPRAPGCSTLESQTPGPRVRRVRVLGVLRVGLHQRPHDAPPGRHAALRRGATRAHPLVVIGGAVTFVNPEPLAPFADVIAAGEGEVPRAGALRTRRGPPAATGHARASRWRARVLRALALRGGVRRRRDASRRVAARPRRRARPCPCARPPSRPPSCSRPARHAHLHAGHRVRVAPADRGGPGVREPVPLLLGRLQLPAGARVPSGSHPGVGRGRRARTRTASAWFRSRCATTRRSNTSCARLWRDGLLASARRRCASTTSPSPIVALLHAERRALDHHRARDRLGPPAPRDQQDRDQRRDPRPGRAGVRRAASRT